MLSVGEELPVLWDVLPPFCGNGELVEDCIYRAYRHAVGTIYASHRVYEIHLVLVSCVDAVHGTHIYTSGVFHVDARFSNDERHAVL